MASKSKSKSRSVRGPRMKSKPIEDLLEIMARLRAPDGCPWDREQDHQSLRYHAVEEVYELLDAIEAGDDGLMLEELGDVLMQVVFHAQLGRERGAFDFDAVCRVLNEKLVRRHPHVFGEAEVRTAAAVWAQWDRIKQLEKAGTVHARESALDGVPVHLPALLRVEKLVKKARKAGLAEVRAMEGAPRTAAGMGRKLYELAQEAQRRGWSAEDLLREEAGRREKAMRRSEREGQSGKG